ncbi:MAG: hypothetical protein O9332_01590 [Microcystis sp. LE19-10.1B]|uniref:hypothetical protein n=1 Tax=Microcystis sp. LE19-10.1B TaxID=3016428 RepID=UPI0022C2836A|nr:hypothetical protein [Microcystis sp. LE19-10.1B]MCZ8024190.1 hypothetical protein [Microcystis sp. LE19-10.1B]MCZ8364904.1 hypothetical protein [Microcystis sp. LE19-251.1A]
MSNKSTIKLVIAFNDPNLEPEERDEQAQVLLTELQQADEVESVKRILDPNPPEGNKSLGGFLGGILMTEVNPANGKKLWLFGLCYAMDGGYKGWNPYIERHLAIFVNCFLSRAN